MMLDLAALAFIAIFFFDVPFPIIIWRPAGNRDFSNELFENTGRDMDDPKTGRIRPDYLGLLVS